jgi:hypothetical protein
MPRELAEALVAVWRQAMVENAKVVQLDGKSYPVRRTPRRNLRQVDFTFDGQAIRGLEQNPETQSRWAQLARAGQKVMQFLVEGRYIGNVANGKVTLYSTGAGRDRRATRQTTA